MGLFDKFQKKETPKKVINKPLPVEPQKIVELPKLSLTRRKDNRYHVEGITGTDLGSIVEMGKSGAKLLKLDLGELKDNELTLSIFDQQVKSKLTWQDKKHAGLFYGNELRNSFHIKNIVRKMKEYVPDPRNAIPYSSAAKHLGEESFSLLINLMAELENTRTNLERLKIYINNLGEINKEAPKQEKEKEKEKEQEEETEKAFVIDIKGELTRNASSARSSRSAVEISDVDVAVAVLGLDRVKEVLRTYIKKNISNAVHSLPKFNEYRTYNILKTVLFKNISPFFNYPDEQGDGSSLLSLETIGIDILNAKGGTDFRAYYNSTTRIYAEASRVFEKVHFGIDMIRANKTYFESTLGMFGHLYDGYILSHFTLNPYYIAPGILKIEMTKNKALLAFNLYLTYLAVQFIMGKDRESGNILAKKMKRSGMAAGQIIDFLNKTIAEANVIISLFGLKGSVKPVASPPPYFKMDKYFPRDVHCEYFIRTFRTFCTAKAARMALRFEDEKYAHKTLSECLNADDFGLNTKLHCVVPCSNLAEQSLETTLNMEVFSFFDLIIFKDIDKLHKSHMLDFLKLWKSFEGMIIVTFSSYSFIDIDNTALHPALCDYIVDFPSCFSSEMVYTRKVEHTLSYLRPFTGEWEVDTQRLFSVIHSMDCIITEELAVWKQDEGTPK
jgi:hypothetical protein